MLKDQATDQARPGLTRGLDLREGSPSASIRLWNAFVSAMAVLSLSVLVGSKKKRGQ